MATTDILVCGAAGRMGQEVVRAISKESDLKIVAAVDKKTAGKDIGLVAGIGKLGIPIKGELSEAIQSGSPAVMVDFTTPSAIVGNVRAALKDQVACVVGTTGLTAEDLKEIARLCKEKKTPAIVAPNFAIGAVLMMEFAMKAARYFPRAEIIELHHDKKLDAPSGTALLTAKKMLEAPDSALLADKGAGKEESARGKIIGDSIRIHSVRLPGLIAHQEVIFGGTGQILTIRHDSLSRESFMPGVLLAIRKVLSCKGLIIGLENLL